MNNLTHTSLLLAAISFTSLSATAQSSMSGSYQLGLQNQNNDELQLIIFLC